MIMRADTTTTSQFSSAAFRRLSLQRRHLRVSLAAKP